MGSSVNDVLGVFKNASELELENMIKKNMQKIIKRGEYSFVRAFALILS